MTGRGAYTHGHAPSVLRSHKWRTVENSAAYLAPRLQPEMSFLDVGCGPGNLTADLASRLAPGRVVGIDSSAQIVGEARQAYPDVEFRVADAYELPFADASFDVVHAHQVLQHLADPVAALREWRRVCRPGGLVAARDADYAAFAWYPHDPLLDRWLELYRRAAHANSGEPDAGRRLFAWANAASFVHVDASASVWCFATAEERAWWGGIWADRILTSSLTNQLVASGVDVGELEAISGAWQRWAVHPDGWFLVPHGEILATC